MNPPAIFLNCVLAELEIKLEPQQLTPEINGFLFSRKDNPHKSFFISEYGLLVLIRNLKQLQKELQNGTE